MACAVTSWRLTDKYPDCWLQPCTAGTSQGCLSMLHTFKHARAMACSSSSYKNTLNIHARHSNCRCSLGSLTSPQHLWRLTHTWAHPDCHVPSSIVGTLHSSVSNAHMCAH